MILILSPVYILYLAYKRHVGGTINMQSFVLTEASVSHLHRDAISQQITV